MKKLQNNFTTPEQSKRLLELGIPADSADCYYQDYGSIPMIVWTLTQPRDLRRGILKPCWSVGRLMEIYITCIEHYTGDERLSVGIDTIRLGVMDCIIAAMEVGCDDGDMDFSKLEE